MDPIKRNKKRLTLLYSVRYREYEKRQNTQSYKNDLQLIISAISCKQVAFALFENFPETIKETQNRFSFNRKKTSVCLGKMDRCSDVL